MIALVSITPAAVIGETEDGYQVRIDLHEDQHGRVPILVTAPGFCAATTVAARPAAVQVAQEIIAERRRGCPHHERAVRAAVSGAAS